MKTNNSLALAKKQKKDEFYTQISDIEKELIKYHDHFKGKVVFCNCDDPEDSHFWKYFSLNFEHLGLEKLISTHFEFEKPSYKMIKTKDSVDKIALEQNGDFRSSECIEILKSCDIVVTNPPFSLFREFIVQLIEYGKDFIVLGNITAVTSKDVFKHIQKGNLWLGHSITGGDREFRVPDDYPITSKSHRVSKEGNKYVRVTGVRWYTNLKNSCTCDLLNLYKEFNKLDYPKYDNYPAINVDKTKEIPCDYFGAMGVPITFLDKYNPKQFEIICGVHNINKSKGINL